MTILACDPPRHLEVRFPDDTCAWHLDLVVEPRGDGAELVFAQTLADGLRREDVESGWTWYLDRLAASLRGAPMPDRSTYA